MGLVESPKGAYQVDWLQIIAGKVGPLGIVLTLIIFWLLALVTRLMSNITKLSVSNAKMITLLEVLVHGNNKRGNDAG